MLAGVGVKSVKLPRRSPNLNAYAERFAAALRNPGRVEDWRHCSVGSVYPLLPVSVGSASLTEP